MPKSATKWPVLAKIGQHCADVAVVTNMSYVYLQIKLMGVEMYGKTFKKTGNNFNISQLCDHTVHHLVTFPETLFQFIVSKTLLKSKV